MKVLLNGVVQDVAAETTVGLLVERKVPGEASVGVAVAVNDEVVPRAEWQSVRLQPEDRIEILRAIGGG